MKTKIFIDPRNNIYYSSFYIQGLYTVFGRKNVSFGTKYFTDLKRREAPHAYDNNMAFVMIEGDSIEKLLSISGITHS